MLIETIYAGRDNSFSLQLVRGGQAINLLSVTGYLLVLSEDLQFSAVEDFIEKPNGIVEISIGDLLTSAHLGAYTAHLITYDPINNDGIRWPNFKLKVK